MRRDDVFQPKYLKGSDLAGKTASVTIERIEIEEVEDGKTKPIMYFVGKDKGMVLNPTNWDMMELFTGQEDSKDWIGATILIWHDPTVMFKGKRTGGMRIKGLAPGQQPSHMPPHAPAPAASLPPPAPDPPPLPEPDPLPGSDDDIPF